MPIDMDPIEDLVGRLNRSKKLRVWSVIITFFGDAVVPRGGSVSARTTQNLLGRMGIEAGAVRTAFSRLTSDGWVVREKLGRSSFFRLSPAGLAPFEAATDRIYAPLPVAQSKHPNGDDWELQFHQDTYPSPIIVPSSKSETREDCFVMRGRITQIPEWLKKIRCQSEHKKSFEVLMQTFAPLEDKTLEPIEALAARCLLIHEWRRILFQFDAVAPQFWTTDWPQADCHRFVSKLYHAWLPASEAWMNEEATDHRGPLLPPKADLAARFA